MIKRITGNLPENKPFMLLRGPSKDFLKVFGISTDYFYVCPDCGRPIVHNEDAIYIALEDKVVCLRCAERWIQYTRYYEEEVKKEKDNLEAMIQKLKDSKLWEE